MLKTNQHLEAAKDDMDRIGRELNELTSKVGILAKKRDELKKEIENFNPVFDMDMTAIPTFDEIEAEKEAEAGENDFMPDDI